MIQNEKELVITKESAYLFEKAVERLDKDPYYLSLSPLKQRIQRQALETEAHLLNEQIRSYETKMGVSIT